MEERKRDRKKEKIGKRKRGIVGGISVICISMLICTGCYSEVSDGVVNNNQVIRNITEYISSRYGRDVNIDHVIVQGGASVSREYIADVEIDNKVYMFKGEYGSDGEYKGTEDTVLNTVVNNRVTEDIREYMKELFSDCVYDVSSNIRIDCGYNFGDIPTYDEIINNSDKLENGSGITINCIVYTDVNKINEIVRGKETILSKLVVNGVPTNVQVFFIDNSKATEVKRYVAENDITSAVAIFTNANKVNKDIDVCERVLKFRGVDIESMQERKNINSYIIKINKRVMSKDSNDNT